MVGKEALAPEAPVEISTVSEALYTQTREALAKEGYTFVVDILPLSIDQLVTNEGEGSRFIDIFTFGKMRSNVPPQVEVAINPNNFRIESSNKLSTDDQIEKIREQETVLKGKLPEEVRNLVSMRMPKHVSVPVQLDFEHQKRTGKVLFTNWLGRTSDETFPGDVASVGRLDPASGLSVGIWGGWGRGVGNVYIFALSVVVLPRKLAI